MGDSTPNESPPKPLQSPNFDFFQLHKTVGLPRASATTSHSNSLEEYRRSVKDNVGNSRSTSPETREENEILYRRGSHYKGEFLFNLINPCNPHRVRLNIERLYWEHWNSLCLAIFLAGVGTSFFLMGLEFWLTGSRAAASAWCMMVVSFLPIIPGYYTLHYIFQYVRCCKGYSLEGIP